MSHITICGASPLRGEVSVQCAKNSVLPILAATLLFAGSSRIKDCPRLRDVASATDILRHLGCAVQWEGADLVVDASTLTCCAIPQQLMCRCRASVIFLGALLARCGEAEMSFPGGCALGARPIDLHLSALRTLGAEIEDNCPTLRCRARQLCGREIRLPFPSVGATENAMLSATAAAGVTTIFGAAREPEIEDLQDFLQKMGADICGAGSDTITIRGGAVLHGCSHRCIGDRIVAATYLCAAAATGGEITLRGADCRHLCAVTAALQKSGCRITCHGGDITLVSRGHLTALPLVRTAPYPGFPTDAQPMLMAALLRAQGRTIFEETMFENRYRHAPQLRMLGADIALAGRRATVCGTKTLCGAKMTATDLRCGAALVVAALSAEGRSEVHAIDHILRGYANIVGDLRALGAHITLET